MDPTQPVYIFGYGSLLRRGDAPIGETPCRLRGYRRRWDVAMDNGRDLPGYKFYVDPETGERPPVFVTFLNIAEDAGAEVNGVVFEVGPGLLDRYDDRERNYRRRDVRALLTATFTGPVWAYVGTPDARRRYEDGRAAGRAVISRGYQAKVIADFASFGGDMLDEFRRTTVPPAVPVRDLLRVALPPR